MKNLKEIEALVMQGNLTEAYDELTAFLAKDGQNASGWFMLGNIYRRKNQWEDAINAYNKAKYYNPEGPADAAIESVYEKIRSIRSVIDSLS
ncbi:MAG: tetratricopeptide repeat protein [Bacteroidales bacterium]|nr:tetratricopeptide repeat protein [Bacteroidales bacterium]